MTRPDATDWPGPGPDASRLLLPLERLRAAAAEHAAQVAVEEDGGALTYASLFTDADRIARRILDRIGGGDAPVIVICTTGADVLRGLLGVVKTGRPYVVLDAREPPERLSFIIEDAAADGLVVDEPARTVADNLTSDARPVIGIDESLGVEAAPVWAEVPRERPFGIIYSSGSTGDPKGVVRSHGNAARSLAHDEPAALGAGSRAGVLWSASAWVTGGQLLPSLVHGGTLSFFDIRAAGLHTMVRWLDEARISTFTVVPSVLRHLLEVIPGDLVFDSLERVLLGGEAVYWRDVDRLRDHLRSDAQIVNRWGMSEVGAVTRYVVPAPPFRGDGGMVPAGYPWHDRTVTIVDDAGKPLPAGGVGRITVRGPDLASGYWRRPELSVATFMADVATGEQEYRSADLGRLGEDGMLELMGRADAMVKVSGLRVEPVEVEQALRALSSIRDAAVVPYAGPDGTTRLVAHVVPAPGAPTEIASWRRQLMAMLPMPMIPSRFVVTDSLPLLASGKVDRRGLAP